MMSSNAHCPRYPGVHHQCLRQLQYTTHVHRRDVQLSERDVVHDLHGHVRLELLARLLELERLLGRVRLLVQPEVHRAIGVHDDSWPERQRRLLRRRDLSHQVHADMLGRLQRRLDVRSRVSRRRHSEVDRRQRFVRLS
jgi:hypothetical protein